ncbi:MAG: hypothetical protein JXA52_01535 [Planctomycetes bacterium]|nr:hypothetical protein [Planctomycetota bacterium]
MRAGEIVIAALLILLGGFIYFQSSQQAKLQAELLALQQQLAANPAQPAAPGHEPDPEALATLIQDLARIDTGIKNLEDKLAEGVAQPLGDTVTPEDAAMILSKATNMSVRKRAAEIFRFIGGEKAEQRLLEMAEQDHTHPVRQAAFYALKELNSKARIPLALKILAAGEMEEQSAAILALENETSPEITTALLKLLPTIQKGHRSEDTLKKYAYEILGHSSAPSLCQELYDAYQNETELRYREEALLALVKCASVKELPLVRRILLDLGPYQLQKSNTMRLYVTLIQELQSYQDLRVTADLLPLLNSQNIQIDRAIFEALAPLADPLAAQTLCEYELTTTDRRTQEYYENCLQSNPALVLNEDTNKYEVISEEKLKELLRKRDEIIQESLQAIENNEVTTE